MAGKKTVFVRQVKSRIGYAKDQQATLRGLGLRRMHQLVALEDTSSVRGMINKITHLVSVEERPEG